MAHLLEKDAPSLNAEGSSEVRYRVPPPVAPFTHVRIDGPPTAKVHLIVRGTDLLGARQGGETIDVASRLVAAVRHDLETNWYVHVDPGGPPVPVECPCGEGVCHVTDADVLLQSLTNLGGPAATPGDLDRARTLPTGCWIDAELVVVASPETPSVGLTYLNLSSAQTK